MMADRLRGLSILVVEDEYLVAELVSDTIQEHGGAVVGPASDIDKARRLVRESQIDGAILDIKLNGKTSLPLVDELVRRGTPVILATGYAASHLPSGYDHLPRLSKPFQIGALLQLIEATFRS
jgi:DNA-binding response OmpR family regulator